MTDDKIHESQVPPRQDRPQSAPPVTDPGRFLRRPVVEEGTHRCKPPDAGFLLHVYAHPAGTVWECGCGQVWHVVWVPDRHYGNRVTVAHAEWQRETPKQRRARLGLRWWQREAR